MKCASDGHKAILSPCGPFIAFKPCFYSSFSFPALFLSTKGSLMHFIPGALSLDGAFLEENRAAAREAGIMQKPQVGGAGFEWQLKIATLCFD